MIVLLLLLLLVSLLLLSELISQLVKFFFVNFKYRLEQQQQQQQQQFRYPGIGKNSFIMKRISSIKKTTKTKTDQPTKHFYTFIVELFDDNRSIDKSNRFIDPSIGKQTKKNTDYIKLTDSK